LAFDETWCQQRCTELGLSLGHTIDYRVQTGSTNDDALTLARAGAEHGTVVVADAQTRARGRRGNAWSSAPGEGLTFSCVVRAGLQTEQLVVLPLVLGLGVREVVAAYVSDRVLVKWPNDVWVGGLKVCGILAESYVQAGRIQGVVAGVGLNVATLDFDDKLSTTATSLWLLGVRNVVREELLVQLLMAFDDRIQRLANEGFESQWRELSEFDALLGRSVRVDQLLGVASGIAKNGALCLDHEGGREEVLAGTVVIERS
jgi:BirA family biotin operon repressor/biotin-[acetyl-CoA-carboxylase] ligase